MTPRTPPRGRGVSPWMRGMRWQWKCMTVWGDEHPNYRDFVRRKIGDEFSFKNSPVQITEIEFED